jgi:DNA-binding MarR family transcriptional regulator
VKTWRGGRAGGSRGFGGLRVWNLGCARVCDPSQFLGSKIGWRQMIPRITNPVPGTVTGNCSRFSFLFVPPVSLRVVAMRGRRREQAMSFSRAKTLGFNGRKRLTLAFLERAYPHQGVRADRIAWETRFSPKRAIYAHLNRLWRWGLIQRRRDGQGLLVYRITRRGRERLTWLCRRKRSS